MNACPSPQAKSGSLHSTSTLLPISALVSDTSTLAVPAGDTAGVVVSGTGAAPSLITLKSPADIGGLTSNLPGLLVSISAILKVYATPCCGSAISYSFCLHSSVILPAAPSSPSHASTSGAVGTGGSGGSG